MQEYSVSRQLKATSQLIIKITGDGESKKLIILTVTNLFIEGSIKYEATDIHVLCSVYFFMGYRCLWC